MTLKHSDSGYRSGINSYGCMAPIGTPPLDPIWGKHEEGSYYKGPWKKVPVTSVIDAAAEIYNHFKPETPGKPISNFFRKLGEKRSVTRWICEIRDKNHDIDISRMLSETEIYLPDIPGLEFSDI